MKRTFGEIDIIEKDDNPCKQRKLKDTDIITMFGIFNSRLDKLQQHQQEICRYLSRITTNHLSKEINILGQPPKKETSMAPPPLKAISILGQPPKKETSMMALPPLKMPVRKTQVVKPRPLKLSPVTKNRIEKESDQSTECTRTEWVNNNFKDRSKVFMEFVREHDRFPRPSVDRYEKSLCGWFNNSRKSNEINNWKNNPNYKFRADILGKIIKYGIKHNYVIYDK
mgnify:CR=1 FL=1|jgi:hypothetical protein